MPCNPAIGGLGKGHLVREIDVLGGQMGLAIDATGIQFRLLNRKKGPAVRSPRAQADKELYRRYMMNTVLAEPRLTVVEGEVTGLITEPGRARKSRVRTRAPSRVRGVVCADGSEHQGRRVVLSSGTFLRGLMHVGDWRQVGGREGADSADGLSGELVRLGFELKRLKTGTPPRLRNDSIDFAALQPQPGDPDPRPFSFRTGTFQPDQILCHLTYTGEPTHRLIRQNLDRSPLFAGVIEGQGPRYCPSIEDKVVRFPRKDRHLIFLEPEGQQSDEIYVNGLSTSLPAEVQQEVVRSIKGLQEAEIVRFGYAVEYDSVPPYQIRETLESIHVDGLYLAGQILGTSGYEEAAAQGLIAGVNAALSLIDQSLLIIQRSEGYMGVLVDDLVTKQISEPYRMFTSRAEHRLALRCDNAETRLLPYAERLKLLPEKELERLRGRVRAAERAAGCLKRSWVTAPANGHRIRVTELLKRPGVDLETVFRDCPEGEELQKTLQDIVNKSFKKNLVSKNPDSGVGRGLLGRVLEEIQTDIKYAGYIARQSRLLRNQAHLDDLELPADLDYQLVEALSLEAREKLARMRPTTLGQASRIDGVRAGDLAVLAVVVRRQRGDRWPSDRSEPSPRRPNSLGSNRLRNRPESGKAEDLP
jgi:tRNA uridine 5-carboxymethylaminomethyl modification enzyme